jgi:hypothetical protein
MTIELSAGCYYLDAVGRAHGPMIAMPPEIATRNGTFYTQHRAVVTNLNSRWGDNGEHCSTDPTYRLVNEFMPAVVNEADFGVPSDKFGYILEALSQIPAMPGGPLIDSMDAEIVAFTYAQFHAVCEFFGLFRTPDERIDAALDDIKRQTGDERAIALIFTGTEEDANIYLKAHSEMVAKLPPKQPSKPAPSINDFQQALLKEIAGMIGVSYEQMTAKMGPVYSSEQMRQRAEAEAAAKKTEQNEDGPRQFAIFAAKDLLEAFGMTDFEDNCGCPSCQMRRQLQGKLSETDNIMRMVKDFERSTHKIEDSLERMLAESVIKAIHEAYKN